MAEADHNRSIRERRIGNDLGPNQNGLDLAVVGLLQILEGKIQIRLRRQRVRQPAGSGKDAVVSAVLIAK